MGRRSHWDRREEIPENLCDSCLQERDLEIHQPPPSQHSLRGGVRGVMVGKPCCVKESHHTSAGLPTPAAGMIPPSGLPVSCTHSAVPLTEAAMLSVSVTSTAKNLARDGPPSSLTSSAPASSLRSRMAMLPPSLFSSTAVARPRPDALFRGGGRVSDHER